ncbi:hypothetical protein CHS0354_002377 [Potamilus streckersoni]|uniref:Uncharacterized protein n=1 Tax=Potamilus streckersoni TaxID=2493646 RepID=A0AAE0VZ34_9BIVA|nr:hypothetical protein CHS0354_002377 [Potamilus streckersoni]
MTSCEGMSSNSSALGWVFFCYVVAFDGNTKLLDTYVVHSQPNPDIPVYVICPEEGIVPKPDNEKIDASGISGIAEKEDSSVGNRDEDELAGESSIAENTNERVLELKPFQTRIMGIPI